MDFSPKCRRISQIRERRCKTLLAPVGGVSFLESFKSEVFTDAFPLLSLNFLNYFLFFSNAVWCEKTFQSLLGNLKRMNT